MISSHLSSTVKTSLGVKPPPNRLGPTGGGRGGIGGLCPLIQFTERKSKQKCKLLCKRALCVCWLMGSVGIIGGGFNCRPSTAFGLSGTRVREPSVHLTTRTWETTIGLRPLGFCFGMEQKQGTANAAQKVCASAPNDLTSLFFAALQNRLALPLLQPKSASVSRRFALLSAIGRTR